MGQVANLREHPDSRTDEEEFDVGGVHFGYSTGEAYTPGFNKPRSAGGPIRDGLPVWITYSGDRQHASILMLEVRSCSTS